MIDCSTMRVAVILSASLLFAGLGLGLIAMTTPLVVPTSYLALILVLSGGAVLSAIFLTALVPGVARRLEECQH